MDWKPTFRVTVNGSDISGLLAPRLASLTITDAAGVQSDTCEITLTDTNPMAKLKVPPSGAEIRVALGYAFNAKDMGLFIADAVECSGPPDMMRISAKAAPVTEGASGQTPITGQKTRSWDAGTTIATLVETIAGEHGLRPGVSASLASLALPHLDQIDESDINLLTRIARDHDAIAKVGGGSVVMAKRGESLTVAGEAMPTVKLRPRDVTSWRWGKSLRDPAGKVVAVYRDQAAAADVEATAGEGDPVRRMRQRFPTQEAAQQAADGEFRRAARSGAEVSLQLPGDPDLVAEARLVLSGFRSEVNGEWLITRVVHTLDASGYRCSVTAEPPDAETARERIGPTSDGTAPSTPAAPTRTGVDGSIAPEGFQP